MKNTKFNAPLVTHMYTADPSVHVFDGKLYIYGSHDFENYGPNDRKNDYFKMEDYHVLSMNDIGEPCIDHGMALHMDQVPWVSGRMWAPDAACKNGKYYFYFPAKDQQGIFHIGVAVGDKPMGPFTPQPSYIPGSFSIDPAVFTDDDNKSYMYFGGLWGGQLEKWKTGEYIHSDRPHGEDCPQGEEPALGPMVAELSEDMLTFKNKPVEIQIFDENGKLLTANDTDKRYFEGPCLHKHNGKYYLSYSTGETHYLVYAESDNPLGPFTYKGRILEPVIGWTTHHYIVNFKGKWYLFYHDSSLSGGITYLRCIKYTELEIDDDGNITTLEPYKTQSPWLK